MVDDKDMRGRPGDRLEVVPNFSGSACVWEVNTRV